ncbi:putative oxidoreductase C162.03-like protein 2 [Colletotrichum chlorophyti]|uniref:Putative oxidoreductase C162.03-like protein 2 n=1 Tax=Colletotrichum chlorophyti TaxID=708187 RepID=A0A1Q8R9Y0_9PEZI|nr:putative oxidoreductase C162.03-like protein 2 [Colletotrichum chlorophyti]
MNPVNTKPYNLPADATWLITGCSSGIGKALATLIASKPGQRLIATARNPSDLSYLPDDNKDILKLALDVTSPSSVNAAFSKAAEHFGDTFHLDIVVNNAGYSLSGDTESATEEQTHQEMETLFFGTARVTTRAIENMRRSADHRGGVIFQMSSLAGQGAFAGHAYYHAGKWAVEGWSESVAREMHPDWNINFCIVEPSGVKTNFEGHSKAHTEPHPAYAGSDMPARVLERYVQMGIKSGTLTEPSAIADAIYNLASRGERVPLRVPLGATAWNMIKMKFETFLGDLENVKEISMMGRKA